MNSNDGSVGCVRDVPRVRARGARACVWACALARVVRTVRLPPRRAILALTLAGGSFFALSWLMGEWVSGWVSGWLGKRLVAVAWFVLRMGLAVVIWGRIDWD